MKEKKGSAEQRCAVRKAAAFLIHAVAFCILVAGVSMIYCNVNFKKGLTWMNSEVFEDSPSFDALLTDKVREIMDYVRYRDVFETGGEVDTDNEVFAYATGDGDEEIWTLDDVLTYAKQHGWSFDNDYHLIHDENAPEGDGRTYAITWRAYMVNRAETGPGDSFTTLDAISKEVLEHLGSYYRCVRDFNQDNSNLYYLIELEGRHVYTNRPGLTEDLARSLGKYVILSSENVVPDNNLSETPDEIRRMIVRENGSSDAEYKAILAVDTSYPLQDDFYRGLLNYGTQRKLYAVGLLFTMAGALLLTVSFLLLVSLTGRKSIDSREIVLSRMDRRTPEGNILLAAAACTALIFLADKTVVRLLHMLIPSDYWVFAEKMTADVLIYLCAMICLFSLIRAAKAHVLWKNSLLRHLVMSVQTAAGSVTFARRLLIYYMAFLAVNLCAACFITWAVLEKHSILSRIFVFLAAAFLAAADLFFFLKLYRKRLQDDRIADAISLLDTGAPEEGAVTLDLGEFEGREARLADSINNISAGLRNALDEQVKSERMKAELITNVSHDIKTPLTSIISYVDLIRRENPDDPKIRSYIEVLDQKSQHLKTLVLDLVEASKASTGNVQINAADIDFVELVEQADGEFEERLADRKLTLVADLPKKSILIRADGQHLWRVLENLYNNACKYAAPGSRVYADMEEADGLVTFTLKNISAQPLNISPEELTERFVRGDASRTTEGSGLGLSIAKSLTELQGGTFRIVIDGDYFKASVTFRML